MEGTEKESVAKAPRAGVRGWKLIVYSLLPCVLFLLLAEVAARSWFYRAHSPYRLGVVEVFDTLRTSLNRYYPRVETQTSATEPLLRPDPVVGFSYIPGVHHLTMTNGAKKLSYSVVIGPDGYRTASPNPDALNGKPGLWILGSSFTWGVGVDNDGTIPWQVQTDMPGWRVRNLSVGGFGNVQGLLQLTDAIQKHAELPKVAVFVYDNDHPAYNVGAHWWLEHFPIWAKADGQQTADNHYVYTRARLTPDGNFFIDYVPLWEDKWKTEEDPDSSYEVLITKIIFYRIRELCIAHGIVPVFALQTGAPGDPIPQYARSLGFQFADFSIDLNQDNGYKYRLRPFDSHPNRAADTAYTNRLVPQLTRITKGN